MLFGLRVNTAIAASGINPASIPRPTLNRLQSEGKSLGLTPQETAILVLSEVLNSLTCPQSVDMAVAIWSQDRKINLEKVDVDLALLKLGIDKYE